MARLERHSLTRWENGKTVTYHKGDDVPDLKSEGSPDKPNVFLTLEEGARVPAKSRSRFAPSEPSELETADQDKDLDIIQLLEGNVPSVISHISTVDQISVLEDILVAEGEGKNRSTVTSAINDRIKTLEEGQE